MLTSGLHVGSIALVQSSWYWKRSRAAAETQIRSCPGHRGERAWWPGLGIGHPEVDEVIRYLHLISEGFHLVKG